MHDDLLELTTHCIRCGFCLESCPTFKLSGEETESPRGRIYLVRSAQEGKLSYRDDVRPHLDACLGCRNCETACPSGVEYGAIFELARARIDSERSSLAKRILLTSLTRPWMLRLVLAGSRALPGRRIPKLLASLLGARKSEAELPQPMRAIWPSLDDAVLPISGQAIVWEGCVMSVLFAPVNEATRRLVRRAGYEPVASGTHCCGALHAHNGRLDEAHAMGAKMQAALPPDLPVVVNSAGCGSTMKESPEAFSRRVLDLSEFLDTPEFRDLLASRGNRLVGLTVTYHDACHLAHGQRVTAPPRRLLAAIPGIRLVMLPESDLCCGSAGIYNIVQPENARRLLERKWSNIEKTGADIVVTGNPGCHAWIEQASRERGGMIRVFHTAELLEAAFSGLPR